MRQRSLFDSPPAPPAAPSDPGPADEDTESTTARTPPERLHRIHVAPALGTGGSSFDLDGVRWRGDAGAGPWKRAVAYRLALCWNLCEGWPTEVLEDGVLREDDHAVEALLNALRGLLDADAGALPASVRELLANCEDVRRRRDAAYDLTNGRPHDCPSCLDE